MDITGAKYSNGTLIELVDVQRRRQPAVEGGERSELVNPTSGHCLDDPNGSTTNGTQLQIWNCSGASNQKWSVP